jgi:ppGpp synthetase/RelA/SpoT-type nucleotidyltranferase
MEIKDNQYQAALKMLTGANDALQHAISGVRQREEARTVRTRIEEVESLLKKAKRELRIA